MEGNINGGEDAQPNDSIPQITGSNEDTGKCDHFSIRAYVAEIRKRDWKICWPFCSSVECKEPIDHHGSWYCRNCLGSSDASPDAADACVVPNISEDKDCEGNVDITSYEYLPLIDLVRKENFPSLMSKTKIRRNVFAYGKLENNVAKTIDEGISEPTCTRRKDIQFINGENVSGDAETTDLDVGDGPNCGILKFEFGKRKLASKRTCSNGTWNKGDPAIAKTCEKGMESITCSQLPESESMESGSLDCQASCYINVCSLKSNRNDRNKEIESVHDEQRSNESYGSTEILKCKRPQKVRLLSDILRREISGGSCDLSSSNGTVISDNLDTRVTDTEAADDSDDLTLDTLFRSQKVVQPNADKITGCKNKRKRLHVEDLGPGESEVSWRQNSNKENNSVRSVIGISASVKTPLSRDVALVSDVSHQAEKRKRKSSYKGRRSSKMLQENPCQELQLVSTDPEGKETQTGTGNREFHLPNDAPTGLNLLKPNVGGSRDCDRKSVSCMKEVHNKGSLMHPHEFVPMKEQVGGKDINIGPYFPASNKGSGSPRHLKNKHGTFKRKKESFFPYNYENNKIAHANSEVTVKEIPSSELDVLDDIPMEIVKLLAENRRERRLLEAETANRETVCLLRSVNGVENHRNVESTRVYDDVKSRDIRKNTSQVQRKPFRVGGDTFDETTSSGMAVPPQGPDAHNLCFPYVVNNTTNINGTQMSASSFPKQRKPLDVEIYSKKTAEKPCACVQKKIGKCPELDASLTTHGNESMPAMQLLRLMESGMSSRTSHSAGLHKIRDSHKTLFPVEQGKHYSFGDPVVHIRSTERNIDSTQIGGTRGQVSGEMVSGSVKSCKKIKLKSSHKVLQAMNGRLNGHVSGKNALGTDGYQSFSFNKGQSSASDCIVLPVEPNIVKVSVKHAVVKKRKAAVAWPVKGGCRSEICSVNRNPADFSIPGTGNKFMRRGRAENSRKGKPKATGGKMEGSINGLISTCVA